MIHLLPHISSVFPSTNFQEPLRLRLGVHPLSIQRPKCPTLLTTIIQMRERLGTEEVVTELSVGSFHPMGEAYAVTNEEVQAS